MEITREIHRELVKFVDSDVRGQYNKGILHMYLMMLEHVHLTKEPIDLNGFEELLDGLNIKKPEILNQ